MMHDVRSMVDNRPTQIPREGWSFTRCVPGCCNQWYERSYKGSKCCDTAGPWTYWPKPPRGSRVPECQDTGNVAACHPMLGDYPEGMLPQGSKPKGDHPNPRYASGCQFGARGSFPKPHGEAPAPKTMSGTRPWPTFKKPSNDTPTNVTTKLNAESEAIDVPHPRGETPGLRGWHGGLGNPEADPGIPWDGNVPPQPEWCNQRPSPPPWPPSPPSPPRQRDNLWFSH